MKKLSLCIFITVFFTGVLHAEDTPYMKLIDSHKGIDKMFVCLPMIQKTADNYKKAISLKNDFAEALNNLGNATRDLNKPEDALRYYERALQFKNDYAEAYNNMGFTYEILGVFTDKDNTRYFTMVFSKYFSNDRIFIKMIF